MLHASLSHCWHKIGGDQVCASTTYQKGKLSLKTLLSKRSWVPTPILSSQPEPLDCSVVLPPQTSILAALPSPAPFPRRAHLNLSLLKNSKQKTSDPYPDPALYSQCRSGEKSNRSMFAQCLLILSLWHLTAHLLQNINALTKKFVRYKITTEEDGKPKGKNEFCCTLTPKAPGAFGHTAAAQLYLQHTTFCHGNWPFSHSKKKSSVLSCTCKYFQHHLL